MLTPAYLAGVSSDVVELFAEVEESIASDMVRRMMKMGYVSETTQWQYKKARELGLFQGDLTSTLSRASRQSRTEISRIMGQAASKALGFDDAIYRRVGLSPGAISSSPALRAILLQGTSQTAGLITNFTKTTATSAFAGMNNLIDRAYIQVMSGAFSPSRAIHNAVTELARNGITRLSYSSGSASVESAVRRAVTTGVNQSIAKLQLARAEEMGCDLVEVSSHAGARPTHAVWQGQVYCIHGYNRTYGDFYAETGYGEGDGLCGWNCYHSFFPFFDGLSTRSFSEDPAADAGRDNDLEYEQQQKQRYYERQVREMKRECVTYNAAANAANTAEEEAMYRADFERASVTLKRREARLQSYLNSTGRQRDRTREQVGGFDRSVSGKAVWANRRASA